MSGLPTETPNEAKARRWRNIAIALALGAFVVIVFLVTVLRIKGHVADTGF